MFNSLSKHFYKFAGHEKALRLQKNIILLWIIEINKLQILSLIEILLIATLKQSMPRMSNWPRQVQ